jgi:hypothetical protein
MSPTVNLLPSASLMEFYQRFVFEKGYTTSVLSGTNN